MNANGVLASMCFPTMAGFNARTFTEAGDKELSLVMLQAYNDWHIDEWCAAYPGRFIPLGIVPMWDIDLAVSEVRRIAAKGCRAISFLEAPHSQGWPSFLSGHWDPMLEALVDNDMSGSCTAQRPHSNASRLTAVVAPCRSIPRSISARVKGRPPSWYAAPSTTTFASR